MKIFAILSLYFSVFLFSFNGLSAELTYKLEKIGDAISHPWGMAAFSDNSWLVTSRSGSLFKINIQSGIQQKIENIPEVFARKQGGLLDVAVSGGDIYLCFSRPQNGGAATALYKAQLEGGALRGGEFLFTSNQVSRSGRHFGCRIAFDDRYIYLSLGDRGARESAQDSTLYAGGIIRLNRDGQLAPAARSGWLAGMFTKGNRNPQGMAIHPQTGAIWVHEHGPKGGDEVNILKAGANYGWPLLSYGQEYFGGKIGDGRTKAQGYTDPVWVWVPSIAPSGMAFYDKDMFSEFKGGLLVGSLKFRELYHIQLENGLPVSEQAYLKRKIGRIRDVAVASDGSILLLSDEANGGVYRLYR